MEGHGLWELLFGVNDPAAGKQDDCVKMETDSSHGQLDLPDDFLALLGDPATQNALRDIVVFSDFGQVASSSEEVGSFSGKVCTDSLDMNTLGELSQYLLIPEMTSSSSGSGSDEDNDNHSVSSSSVQGSPLSVHSDSFIESVVQKGKEELKLSKEELALLSKEGLTLPKFLPLSKHEERILKKIRRKIRNKKSAQESRRKKKVYVDQLEDQVKDVTNQNKTLHKRVKDLEKENSSLQQQLKTLQSVLGRSTRTTKATGTCLMALVLSVALIITPYGKNLKDQEQESHAVLVGAFEPENVSPVQSRLLYSLDGPPDIKSYGIPLANPFKKSVTAPVSSEGIQLEQWDGGYGRATVENLTIEIPKEKSDSLLF